MSLPESTVSPARRARIVAAHAARRVTKPGLFTPVDPNARVFVVLPYPPSANLYWRTRVGGRGPRAFVQTYVSEEAKQYKADVERVCRDAGIRPLIGDVSLIVNVYRPRKAGDLSNRIKVLEDALGGFAFEDDSQVRRLVFDRVGEDKDRPRVEVVVIPYTSPVAPQPPAAASLFTGGPTL